MTYILREADRPIAEDTARLIAESFNIERLTTELNSRLISSQLQGTNVIEKVTYRVDKSRDNLRLLDGLSNEWIARLLEAYFDRNKVLTPGDDFTFTAVVVSDAEQFIRSRCRYYGIRLLVSPVHADQ